MTKEWTEDEMRRALFGDAEKPAPAKTPSTEEVRSDAVSVPEEKKPPKKRASEAFTSKLKVTLRVSNEFEGKTFELVHEANTLSTLLAEQEATKVARKKFRYVEVVSVEPV